MDAWLTAVVVLIAIVVVLLAGLALLALRRRWLSREGGTFECSVRLGRSTPGAGWVLGLARYNAEKLEWFRFFSYSARPRKTFLRNEVRILQSRDPDPVEAVALYAGQRVVVLEEQQASTVRVWDLAMGSGSLTGLLSWLEAAPPGIGSL